MNRDLEIDLLKAFAAVAEAGTFTRAARRLHRVQSAVSMQVKRLEDVLDCRLFTRGQQGVALTGAGEILLQYARQILALNRAALDRLRTADTGSAVRLGIVDIYAASFLPAALADLARAYPSVEVRLTCGDSWQLMGGLTEGTLDLALVTRQGEFPRGTLVRREPLAWTVARGSAADRMDPLPLALFARECACRRAALAALCQRGRTWRVACSCESYAGMVAACESGGTVSVLPRLLVKDTMRVLGESEGFPDLPPSDLSLHWSAAGLSDPGIRLAELLRAACAADTGAPGAAG